jgi:PEP-CTERM motif
MPFSNARKELFRLFRTSFAVITLALMAPVAVHATPITYDLTLIETDGHGTTYSGTGQVTLDVTGGIKNGVGYITATGLTAMQFTVDGQTFNITDPTNQGNATIGFNDASTGSIWDVTFSETNANKYRLIANGGIYQFYTPINIPVTPGNGVTGDFTGSIAPPHSSVSAATPEPGTLALLGTGLLTCVGSLRRRIRRS